jgi:hypothetical protein
MNSWAVPRFAYKTGNTARSSTTTPTADPQLSLPVDANAVYQVSAELFYSAGSTGDLLVQWFGTTSWPTGATGTWTGIGNGTSVASANGSGGTQLNIVSSAGYTLRTEATDMPTAARTFGGITSSDNFAVFIRGLLVMSSTSGTLAVNWCQNASDATNTTLFANSWLKLDRVG